MQARYGKWLLGKWLGWAVIIFLGLIFFSLFHKSDTDSSIGTKQKDSVQSFETSDHPMETSNPSTESSSPPTPFEKVRKGMSQIEVEQILGSDPDVLSDHADGDDTFLVLEWVVDGTDIKVEFKNDKVTKKEKIL